MDTNIGEKNPALAGDVKQRLSDIVMKIAWREVAHDYFGKSSSWLYHKLDGIDGNGGSGGFTPEELQTLKDGLADLSDRIRAAADKL